MATAWVRPSLWEELSGDPRTSFSSETGFVPFRADIGEPWAEIDTGFTVQASHSTSVYASGSYQFGLLGDSDAWSGQLGLRVNW